MILRLTYGLVLLLGITSGQAGADADTPRIVSLNMVSRQSGWAISGTASSYHVLRTRDGCRHWKDVSPPGFAAVAPNDWDHDIQQGSVGSDFPDARSAWLAIVTGRHSHEAMHLYHTTDGGRHWTSTRFATTNVGSRTYVQFTDRRHGFILSVSDPAAGLMEKRVYRTIDGGRHWQWMSDVRGEKHGYWSFYPSGMTFRSPTEGWITGSYHGEPPVPFLHTRNGGRTWDVQELPVSASLADGYGDTEPPVFFAQARRRGVFSARLVNGIQEETATFWTRDGGANWRGRRTAPLPDAISTCSTSSRDGWILDGDASALYGTHDEGRTWHRLTSSLRRQRVLGIVSYQKSQIDFITARVGWALIVGQRDVSLPPEPNRPSEIELRQTQDGGRHWRTIHPRQE